MATIGAGWNLKEVIGVESEWILNKNTYTGQLSDAPLATNRKKANDGKEASATHYSKKTACTVIEIVKRDGCYVALEDGAILKASRYSRDQQNILDTYPNNNPTTTRFSSVEDIMMDLENQGGLGKTNEELVSSLKSIVSSFCSFV